MKKLLFILPAFLLMAVSACRMSGAGIPDDKKEYIGNWQSEEMQLYISKNGHVDYKRVKGSGTTNVSAPLQKFEGDDFIVGALGINTVFDVSVAPHAEAGVWKMTVDGIELTRE